MKKWVLGLVLVFTFSSLPAFSAIPPKPGSICSKQGFTKTYKGKKYTCIKSGKKLVWNKGVAVKKADPQISPTPVPTPSQLPSPTPTPSTAPSLTPTPSSNTAQSSLSPTVQYLNVNSCKLKSFNNQNGLNQSFNLPQYRVKSDRSIRVLIFPIDFPDLISLSDPQTDFEYVAKGVSEFFSAMSYGKATFRWTIYPKFVRYGSNVSDANLGGRNTSGYPSFHKEAMRLANLTLDLTQFDLVIFAPPRTTRRDQIAIGPAFGSNSPDQINATMLDGQSYDATFPFTTAHEIGHLMGLADLYNFNASSDAVTDPAKRNAFELQFKYMGIYDLMNWAGGLGVELTTWNRWLLNFITDDQIRCLPQGESITLLSPIEINGGIKGAVIPLSSTQAIVIESRRALGFDQGLRRESEGALVYKVDTSIPNGMGPMRIIGRTGSNDIWLQDAPLKLGETYLVEGYRITVIETGVFGDVIKVSKS
jgi:M6 family metalloprotease-like protein